jgi:hypothetical protein
MSLAKHADDEGQAFTQEEWDLLNVPPSELKACFLYEYARESPTIRAIAQEMKGYLYTDGSDWSEPNLWRLRHHNYECGMLLAHVGPDLDLGIPWQSLDKTKEAPWQREKETKRAFLARVVRKVPCFREAPFHYAEVWDDLRRRDPDSLKKWANEVVSFWIDWSKPVSEIQKQASDWLAANPRAKRLPGKRRRHARENAKYKDGLRGLGALRLWAQYPLKQAMQITKDCGVYLYSRHLDQDGRPVHQTAWDNGARGVVKLLQNTFALSKTEMPLSWQKREKRRRPQK